MSARHPGNYVSTASAAAIRNASLAIAFLIAFAAGCRPLPRDPIVESLQIRGVRSVDVDAIEQGLSTGESPKLFGFIPRVLEYSTYDAGILERDLLRIERYLRARGYYSAKVIAARVIHTSTHSVRVQISVQEGEPVRVSRIEPGISALPFDVMLIANRAREMTEGDLLDEDRFEADRARIERALFDAGYAFAQVKVQAVVDLPSHTATLRYDLQLGPKAVLGKVMIVGLQEIPEGPVRDNLNLSEGDTFSESDLEDAQQALLNLGVFSNVDVLADRTHPETGRVPITVQLRETALRSVRAGVGARFDVQRFASVFEVGWEHKNFFGGMRRFSIQARPGLTFYPTRIDRLELWSRYLPENRLGVTLRQPSFLEGRTTLAIEGEYNVYPLLYPLPESADARTERIIGYQELRSAVRLERAFLNHHLNVAPSLNFQANFPFAYQAGGPGLNAVRVSFPELVTSLTFVDNVLEPHSGVSLS
ncbi:MAG TPA: POTRA domain-containing protein, partial [Polyangiaceae bacterium]|nr:POTRA domain-containing protein [Polyangiaceae bacterium]